MRANTAKEPLMHIVKRDPMPFWQAALIRALAIIASLIVCAIIIFALTGLDPLEVYASMFSGALGTTRRMWVMLRETAMLLCVGLAIIPAFRMRFWNIGAEGQVLVGAVVTAAVMIYGGGLPPWLLYTLCPLAGVAAGAIWGFIPAFFKARWKTNETLFTLMLNYIAMQLVAFCVLFWENPRGSNSVGLINKATEAGWLPEIAGNDYLFPIIIVLALSVIAFVYMRYSKQGYEIAVVGESENTARYAGINVRKVIMRTMAISGAVAGLVGYLLVCGSAHTISVNLSAERGFTAIIVAWLGKLNPFIMIAVSFLLVFLEKGSGQIASDFNLNESASDILTGIILFFLMGCEFFINYRVEFRARQREEVRA